MAPTRGTQIFDHIVGAMARLRRLVRELGAGFEALHRLPAGTNRPPLRKPAR